MSIESNIFRMYHFTEAEQAEFYRDYSEVRKDPAMAIKLAIFTGFIGGHHFYMKRIWAGLASIVFCWTFIPLIEGLIEAIFLPQLVRELNEEEAVRIANSINLARQLKYPGQVVELPASPGSPVERIIIKEIVKVPCKYCGSFVENTAPSCPQCGGQLQ